MFANLKLVLRRYTSLYGIFMSASLTLYGYTFVKMFLNNSEETVYSVYECAFLKVCNSLNLIS